MFLISGELELTLKLKRKLKFNLGDKNVYFDLFISSR